MNEGTVISIDPREGKGFILEANGDHIIFMISSVVGLPVAEEDKVNYDIVETPLRQAVNVTKAEPGPA